MKEIEQKFSEMMSRIAEIGKTIPVKTLFEIFSIDFTSLLNNYRDAEEGLKERNYEKFIESYMRVAQIARHFGKRYLIKEEREALRNSIRNIVIKNFKEMLKEISK